jgi:hypothetical protein
MKHVLYINAYNIENEYYIVILMQLLFLSVLFCLNVNVKYKFYILLKKKEFILNCCFLNIIYFVYIFHIF